MLYKDWPHKIYVGQGPIFHGPVILSYLLMNEGHTWDQLISVTQRLTS